MIRKEKYSINVCIIDYGLGNTASVKNAFSNLGVPAVISNDEKIIRSSTHLVLPGVGSFEAGMQGLKNHSLIEILTEQVCDKKKKILGVCLGMQLFATIGKENGSHQGLDFVAGSVEKIDVEKSRMRLPHIGWNNISTTNDLCISTNINSESMFYFVHTYHLIPENSEIIAAACDYGVPITALIQKGNIFGAQFHPEKSHTDGMQVINNFLSC